MNNPYSPPDAILSGAPDEAASYTPSMFQLNGRIGRVRYMAYLFGLGMLFIVALALVAVLLRSQPLAVLAIQVVQVAGVLAIGFIVARRRLHDMGRSGWLALGTFIPLVNFLVGLWLVFAPGATGANRFGPPPGPNTRGLIFLAALLPAAFIAGVLAIALAPQKSAAERAISDMEQAV